MCGGLSRRIWAVIRRIRVGMGVVTMRVRTVMDTRRRMFVMNRIGRVRRIFIVRMMRIRR